MKKIFIMMIGLLFAVSTAFASPSTQSDVVTMSKADSQALFGDSSVSVVALGSDELQSTKGEGFWGGVFGGLVYTDYQLYSYYRYDSWGWNQGDFWTGVGVGAGLFPW